MKRATEAFRGVIRLHCDPISLFLCCFEKELEKVENLATMMREKTLRLVYGEGRGERECVCERVCVCMFYWTQENEKNALWFVQED